ncbi:MAG: hypothetical protein P8P20_10240, partial [Acidimicrobiales bacterium]|nr:hypothetical protein [Acidimicrobiales bacterium]
MTAEAETGTTPGSTASRAASRPPALSVRDHSGFRWMYVVDVITLFGAMLLISFVRWGVSWPSYSIVDYLAGFAVVTVVHIV